MSVHYKQLLKVLEKWPQDKTKTGRDLGERLREQLKILHSTPAATNKPEESENLTEQIESLERLSKNVYYNKYRRLLTSTATGLNAQECNQVLSSEFLQYLNKSDKKD